MLIRLLLIVVLVLGALALPASASADDYVPGEVIVHYEDGTTRAVTDALEDDIGTEAEQALPGGSEQLAIEDGDSVRRPSPSSSTIPTWPTPCPICSRTPLRPTSDPGSRRQWNLFGPFGINLLEAWTLAEARGAPGGRGAVVAVIDSGVAYESRGPLQARPGPAQHDVRQALRLHRR